MLVKADVLDIQTKPWCWVCIFWASLVRFVPLQDGLATYSV